MLLSLGISSESEHEGSWKRKSVTFNYHLREQPNLLMPRQCSLSVVRSLGLERPCIGSRSRFSLSE